MHHVNHSTIRGLAQSNKFNWMVSIRPVRAILTKARKSSACCGKRREEAKIDKSVFVLVSKHPNFLKEMQQLKEQLKVLSLIINVGECRSTI